MKTRVCLWAVGMIALGLGAGAQARDLTFEDRIKVQEAIERVYHSHQVGSTKPFEQVFPRSLLAQKVARYSRESNALESTWGTPVTAEMLRSETERMMKRSRMPGRLRELFAALHNDPFIIQECLARQALVDRLAHNFFQYDARIHAHARGYAETLREELPSGHYGAGVSRAASTTVEYVVEDPMGSPPSATLEDGDRRERRVLERIEAAHFHDLRQRLGGVGRVAPVEETRESFVVRKVLAEEPDRLRVAVYSIAKVRWEDWWKQQEKSIPASCAAVASEADHAFDVLPAESDNSPGTGKGVFDIVERSTFSCDEDDTWNNGSLDDLPDSRQGHTAVWTGSVMLVWGGVSHTHFGNGGRYDPATDTWVQISIVNAPSPRDEHAAVWTGREMIVWGGADPSSSYLETGGRYDPVSDTWVPTSLVDAPTARSNHSMIWTDSRMIVWGGYGPGGEGYQRSGGIYDPSTDTWTATSLTQAPAGRSKHVGVWTGTEMVVWGGYPESYPTGSRYDPVNDSWRPMSTDSGPQQVGEPKGVWTGSEVIVWNGPGLGGRYDPASDTWRSMSFVNAPPSNYDFMPIWTGNAMIVWGGMYFRAGLPKYSNEGGSYDPICDSWTPTAATSAPQARHAHSVIWTGKQMIVWGGHTEEGYAHLWLNNGGRYDPSKDAWTPTATSTAPMRRSRHTAIWTGTHVVIWGGYFCCDPNALYPTTGGRYDTTLDTWLPTTQVDAPPGRVNHSAIWTGSEMIVWGGGDDFGDMNSGGKYDPASDRWLSVTTTGAPSKRSWHSSVWTGSAMLTWGGYRYYPGQVDFQDGGRYDPDSDSWTPLTLTGAPSARREHQAVWTGDRMLVWGGQNRSDGFLRSGGLYDPENNRWMPISQLNAPISAASQRSVWTGRYLVVWGGQYINTGGRYSPEMDTWTPTSVDGAPTGRASHAMVWTGHEVIVWGGRWLGPDNSGGRYDPDNDSWLPTSQLEAPRWRESPGIWTGSQMIVWGGYGGDYLDSGGAYSIGHHRDDDGDGLSECDGDCNDGDPAIHPDATELCNGWDDNCDAKIDEEDVALCSDINPCTDDSCVTGACIYAENSGPCDDGNACSREDVCIAGVCTPGRPVLPKIDCNDHNSCTYDLCDPDVGCMHSPILCRDNDRDTIDSCDPRRGCVFTPRHRANPLPDTGVQSLNP